MGTTRAALVGDEVTQPNANSCQRVSKYRSTKATPSSSQILETIEESRLRTGCGGAQFTPSGQSLSSDAEKEGGSFGKPKNVAGKLQQQSEEEVGGDIEEKGSENGATDKPKSSVSEQQSNKWDRGSQDEEGSERCLPNTGGGGVADAVSLQYPMAGASEKGTPEMVREMRWMSPGSSADASHESASRIEDVGDFGNESEVGQRSKSTTSDKEASTFPISTSEVDSADFCKMHLGNMVRGRDGRHDRNLPVMPVIPHEIRYDGKTPNRIRPKGDAWSTSTKQR